MHRNAKSTLLVLCIGLAYAMASFVGLAFRTEPEKFAIFWPPNGLLLGLLLALDRRTSLIVATCFTTCFVCNLLGGNSIVVSLCFTLVNIFEPCLTAAILHRLRRETAWLSSAHGVFLLAAVSLGVCTVAAVGGAAIVVFGLGAEDFSSVWLTFLLSDFMSAMLVSPWVLAWAFMDWLAVWSKRSALRCFEILCLVAGLSGVSYAIFDTAPSPNHYLMSYPFLVFPFLIWSALRLRECGASLAILLLSLIAIWHTAQGRGPYAETDVPITHRLMAVQLFLTITALSTLALAGSLAEREKIQSRLRDSEERYREIAENIAEVFWVVEPDMSRIHYISPAYEAIWDRTSASLLQDPMSFLESIHPDDRPFVLNKVSQLHSGVQNYEFRIHRSDRTIRWINTKSFPVYKSDGNVQRIVGICQDITDRKNAEFAQEALIDKLQVALAEIKALRGLIPICAWCKKLRDDAGFWQQWEDYFRNHTDAQFSHGICPVCLEQETRNLRKETVVISRKGMFTESCECL